MRRVPEWLPEVLAWRNPHNRALVTSGAIPPGIGIFNAPEPPPTRMDLVVYPSPAIINGLLMTEVYESVVPGDQYGRSRVERFFFGYRCGDCKEVFLVRKDTRMMEQLERDLYHDCDPSDLRRAVRNARELGCERGEYVMDGIQGRWWIEKRIFDLSER